MKRYLAVLLLATPALAAGWSNYVNERFGAAIDIPPGFESDMPGPENGDGLTFRNTDDRAELRVWGGNLPYSFKEDAAETATAERESGFAVSYEKAHNLSLEAAGKGWYVLSGEGSGRIFYMKAVASCRGEQAVYFRIEYPAGLKREFDPVVTRLSVSLHAAPALECPDG